MRWNLKLLASAFSFLALNQPAFAIKVGDVLPKISVKSHDGAAAEPWSGKPSLINFWATWCDACKVELKEMSEELKKISPESKVIFVSLDKESSKAKEWMAKEFKANPGMVENLYYDDSFKMADALGVESFPMTLIVDAKGKVLKIQDGFKEGTGSTEALFETLRKSTAK